MNASSGNFWDWLPKLNDGDATAILILSIFAIVGIVGIISLTVCRVHKNRLEDTLKRELLDRGMTAEEIATVINSGQQGSKLK